MGIVGEKFDDTAVYGSGTEPMHPALYASRISETPIKDAAAMLGSATSIECFSEPRCHDATAPCGGDEYVKRAQRWALGILLPAAAAGLNCHADKEEQSAADTVIATMALALRDYARFEPRFSGFIPVSCEPDIEPRRLIPRRTCLPPPATRSTTFERLAKLSPNLKRLDTSSTPAVIRAHAIWSLLWSDDSATTERAVAHLRRAHRSAPASPEIANDLVAALIALGQQTQSPLPLVESLDQALEAIAERLDSHELAENHDLLRRLLRLPSALDGSILTKEDSDWAANETSRAAGIRRGLISQLELASQTTLSGLDLNDVYRLPEAARDAVFREVLPLGASQSRSMRSADKANQVLLLAEAVAEQINSVSGDASLVAAVAELRSSTGTCSYQLWQAHELLGSGMEAFDSLEVEKAADRLGRAIPLFECRASPAASWARLWLAGSLLYGTRKEEASQLFHRVRLEGADLQSPALSARALWGQGTVAILSARPSEAAKHYQEAFQIFAGISERRNAGAVARLLDGVLDEAGFFETAWRVRLRALDLLEQVDDPRWLVTAWIAASRAARRDSFNRAAGEFASEAIRLAKDSGDSVAITSSLLEAAQAARTSGDFTTSRKHLESARKSQALVGSQALRDRLDAELVLGMKELDSVDLTSSVTPRELDRAIGAFERQQNWIELARLLFLRGRSAAQARDLDRARADFVASARLVRQAIEQGQSLISDHYLEANSDLLGELLATEVQRGEGLDSVLAITELLGSGSLGSAAGSLENPRAAGLYGADLVAKAARRVVSGECIVRFLVTRSHLASWLVTSEGSTTRVTTIASSELRRQVDAFVDALERDGPLPEIRRIGSGVMRYTLDPLEPQLSRCRDLVIVPDSVLAGLPFAALPIAADGSPLVSRASIRIIPSLDLWLRGLPVTAALRSSRHAVDDLLLLYEGQPSDNDTPLLPAVRAELASLTSLYHRTRLLDVSAPSFRRDTVGLTPEVVHYAGHFSRTVAPNPLGTWHIEAPNYSAGVPAWNGFESTFGRPPRVVVLAGCETGVGPTGHWSGTLGMGKRLALAGVQESVLTYWGIQDDDATLMTTELHRGLANGRTAFDALRSAQLRLHRSQPPTDISTSWSWAAFFVVASQ